MKLRPHVPPSEFPLRPDDIRLGNIVQSWTGDLNSLPSGRPVLVGFPQDEGVRRNGGRPGAAAGPAEIRRWLYRLVVHDASEGIDLINHPPIDVGDVMVTEDLEASQRALGEILGRILARKAIPVILGGGHEVALGSYLGYVAAGRNVGILNLDAHLDVRPTLQGLGHSGSPFRQAMEWPVKSLPGSRYVCLGAQPFAVSRDHVSELLGRGGAIEWRDAVTGCLEHRVRHWVDRLAKDEFAVHLSLDADVVRAADVPGVSAPNPTGLEGEEVARVARSVGRMPEITSIELAEIAPRFDVDQRGCRWAGVVVWHFLMGVEMRRRDR